MKNRIQENLDKRYETIQRVEGMAFGVSNLEHQFEPFAWFVAKVWKAKKAALKAGDVSLSEIRKVRKVEWMAILENEVTKIEQEWKESL